jgi:hypothetical protein
MAKSGNWKKPKKAYRVHIKSWERFVDDDGKECIEYYNNHEDILYEELDAELVSDFYVYYDWLWWDENSDWEIEKVEEVEIWSWKEFRNTGRWRGFYEMHGYGSNLHV